MQAPNAGQKGLASLVNRDAKSDKYPPPRHHWTYQILFSSPALQLCKTSGSELLPEPNGSSSSILQTSESTLIASCYY